MNTKVRIGVMGCANIAQRSTIEAIQNVHNLELVAVASRSKEKAEMVAQTFKCEAIEEYQDLLDRKDIDAIYMPLPTGLHEEWILKSIDAGKHVHVEKSFAMNHESAIRMIDRARNKNLLITENLMFVYHNQHSLIREMIDNEEIGEVRLIRSSFGFPPFPDSGNFRYNSALGGGALLDAAAYTVKASQLLLGMELTVKGAQLYYDYSKNVDIYGSAYLTNATNQQAQLGFGFDNFYQCNYEIWGSKGKIVATKAFTPRPNQKPLIIIEKPNGIKHYEAKEDDHFVNIFQSFADCISKSSFDNKYKEILNQSRLLSEIRTHSNKSN